MKNIYTFSLNDVLQILIFPEEIDNIFTNHKGHVLHERKTYIL